MKEPLIAIVGKPSSGKLTTLNSLTDAGAKVGAFPFTTIEPNKATGYVQLPCACARFCKQDLCKPNYGVCKNGIRHVPIQLLDVAGLVPGAHEGRGLGNRFLFDLLTADALVHVVDVSGTTDAAGKATRGYDPLADVTWLQDEIRLWVQGNLTKNWGSVIRRHTATKSAIVDTLQRQFSGYGANVNMVQRALLLYTKQHGELPPKMEEWDNDVITKVVQSFMAVKFPTVLALNKIDHPDADKNVSKIVLKFPETKAILTLAISEVFLRKLEKQGYIAYDGDFIDTYEDNDSLKVMDVKLAERVERIKDLVLYRFGSTGVAEVLRAAVEVLDLIPVFPVRNINTFSGNSGKEVFRDCVLVKKGSLVGKVAKSIMGEVTIVAIEGPGGVKIGEDDVVEEGKNDIMSFKVV